MLGLKLIHVSEGGYWLVHVRLLWLLYVIALSFLLDWLCNICRVPQVYDTHTLAWHDITKYVFWLTLFRWHMLTYLIYRTPYMYIYIYDMYILLWPDRWTNTLAFRDIYTSNVMSSKCVLAIWNYTIPTAMSLWSPISSSLRRSIWLNWHLNWWDKQWLRIWNSHGNCCHAQFNICYYLKTCALFSHDKLFCHHM